MMGERGLIGGRVVGESGKEGQFNARIRSGMSLLLLCLVQMCQFGLVSSALRQTLDRLADEIFVRFCQYARQRIRERIILYDVRDV